MEAAILEAANLGDDADTTAAIVEQLAGTHDAVDQLPPRWLRRLHMRAAIEEMALALLRASQAR